MMTLKRFKMLLDSYGADLQRWPQEERGEAQALLADSAVAQSWYSEAMRLDAAIAAASASEDEGLWPAGEMDAALMRVRLGVEAQIAQRTVPVRGPQTAGRYFPLRWLGMATGGGFVVTAGLLIGLTTATSSMSEAGTDTVLAMLQPAPIPALADFGGEDGSDAR